jgi:hypothetical protein
MSIEIIIILYKTIDDTISLCYNKNTKDAWNLFPRSIKAIIFCFSNKIQGIGETFPNKENLLIGRIWYGVQAHTPACHVREISHKHKMKNRFKIERSTDI